MKYEVSYDVREDESNTWFVATFTVEADNTEEAKDKAGELIYGVFSLGEYSFDWESPTAIKEGQQ
jgi:hypothetical protein